MLKKIFWKTIINDKKGNLMKVKRKIIEIDEELCDGCGICVPACAEGAIQIIDGKAKLVSERYCDGLGSCIGECPKGALRIIEREAEDFDEDAVEEYLSKKEESTLACGCPSTTVQTFTPDDISSKENESAFYKEVSSALSHWPVQINLIPDFAPFLIKADLLILADCAAVAYPNLHNDFIKNRVVMMGCPKFDDINEYQRKFTEIFKKADIKKITAVIMEVPCCSGLPFILKKAIDNANLDLVIEQTTISIKGEIIKKEYL